MKKVAYFGGFFLRFISAAQDGLAISIIILSIWVRCHCKRPLTDVGQSHRLDIKCGRGTTSGVPITIANQLHNSTITQFTNYTIHNYRLPYANTLTWRKGGRIRRGSTASTILYYVQDLHIEQSWDWGGLLYCTRRIKSDKSDRLLLNARESINQISGNP